MEVNPSFFFSKERLKVNSSSLGLWEFINSILINFLNKEQVPVYKTLGF
jgi:hypothetical protein